MVLNPRQKAEFILSWAKTHIEEKPCGGSAAERACMRELHAETIRIALTEPGVEEALTRSEKARLVGILSLTRE